MNIEKTINIIGIILASITFIFDSLSIPLKLNIFILVILISTIISYIICYIKCYKLININKKLTEDISTLQNQLNQANNAITNLKATIISQEKQINSFYSTSNYAAPDKIEII